MHVNCREERLFEDHFVLNDLPKNDRNIMKTTHYHTTFLKSTENTGIFTKSARKDGGAIHPKLTQILQF